MLVLVVLCFGVSVRPKLMGNIFFAVFLFCLMMLANFGSYWMLYQPSDMKEGLADMSSSHSFHLCLSGIRSFVSHCGRNFKGIRNSFVEK